MQITNVLLIAALSGLSHGQWAANRAAPRIDPTWFIEQPDPFEMIERPDAYEAPEIPDALLLSAIRNDPGAHQAIDNYRIAHRAAYDAKVSRYQQQFTNPAQRRIGAAPIPSVAPARVPVQTVPVQAAPVQAAPVQAAPVQAAPVQAAPVQPPVHSAPNIVNPAPVPTQRVSSHRAQVPLYNFIEQPDPFEILERPDAYEAPEIPDALLLSAIRNDPGAHQAIDNYRRAHRAAYDAKVSRYQQQFMPQASTPIRTAPATVRQLPAQTRQLPSTAPRGQLPAPVRQLPAPARSLSAQTRQLPAPVKINPVPVKPAPGPRKTNGVH